MMKPLLLAFALLGGSVHATQLGLFITKQPLYLHGTDLDIEIVIADVPVAYSGSSWASHFGAIAIPFIPPTDGSWREPHDVNLASVYGVTITTRPRKPNTVIVIDAAAAKAPEDYPFTIEQVVDAIAECIELMIPKDTTELRIGFSIEALYPGKREAKPIKLSTQAGQGGAVQPATAVDSKSEGKEKPKPESEGRSQ